MRTFIVDAFTSQPFSGNPAGVCFPGKVPDDDLMLLIARELGHSETAFVLPGGDPGYYSIRYFSPKKEIPLCGHATLASAAIIFNDENLREIHFITVQQLDLLVRKNEDSISMEFPVYNTTPIQVPGAVMEALGIKSAIHTAYSEANKIVLIEISDAVQLLGLQPDFEKLLKTYQGINGVLVTASSNDEYDYHYRYFWPWAGTNEDPVTGGVQTFLAKYWSVKLGKKIMKAFQSSARTGSMTVEVVAGKVIVSGQARIIFEGRWLMPGF